MNITPEQALNKLYLAARQAKLTADEHVVVQLSKEILAKVIKPEVKQEPIEQK